MPIFQPIRTLLAMRVRVFAAYLALFACGFSPSARAASWVETAITGHTTDILVETSGVATVRQQLTLRVRGGPLEHFDIPGAPSGIEILPDAALRRADAGNELLYPLDVQSTNEGVLRLSIQSERGVRGGTYLFDFSYRAQLSELLNPIAVEGGTGLSYTGPRLPNGVDSAKVIFRLPHGVLAPTLWTSGDETGLVLLQSVQKASDFDEVTLVRAHVAVMEPALWKIIVDRELFPTPSAPHQPQPLATGQKFVERALVREGLEPREVGLSIVVALLFGGLLLKKTRLYHRACRGRGVSPRALIPLGVVPRVCLVALSAGMATYGALVHQLMWTALAATMVILLATELWPRRASTVRGPGNWELLDPERLRRQAEKRPTMPKSPFELTSLRGGLFAGALLALAAWWGLRSLASAPYLSLMMCALVVLLSPLFLTGTMRDLPLSATELGEKWAKYFENRLKDVELSLWGRIPMGDLSDAAETEPDEVRIRVKPHRVPRGLRAFEIGFEDGARGVVRPCVVVRVVADSEAESLIGPREEWTRGRSIEEKVLVLRPEVATAEEATRVAQRLLKRLTSSASKPSSKSAPRKSSGSGASTLKPKLSNPVPVV